MCCSNTSCVNKNERRIKLVCTKTYIHLFLSYLHLSKNIKKLKNINIFHYNHYIMKSALGTLVELQSSLQQKKTDEEYKTIFVKREEVIKMICQLYKQRFDYSDVKHITLPKLYMPESWQKNEYDEFNKMQPGEFVFKEYSYNDGAVDHKLYVTTFARTFSHHQADNVVTVEYMEYSFWLSTDQIKELLKETGFCRIHEVLKKMQVCL